GGRMQQAFESNARASEAGMAELRTELRASGDRMQQAVESNARASEAGMAELRASGDRMQQAVESNARAIEAFIGELRDFQLSITTELRTNMSDAVSMVTTLADTMQVRDRETDRRIQALIDSQQGTDRRIQSLIDSQQENAQEHAAFRENSQRIFLEIQSIWQRLAS
ncbi:MAG: hypothetical protein AAGC54_12990, partial [Cyanobacteria bacterium P01_F01_bin.4]